MARAVLVHEAATSKPLLLLSRLKNVAQKQPIEKICEREGSQKSARGYFRGTKLQPRLEAI